MANPAAENNVVKLLAAFNLADSTSGRLKPGVAPVTAKAADYTVSLTADLPGTIFTNYGASGAVIFTLPTPAAANLGWEYAFAVVVGQSVTVASATADTLIAFNDLAADSLGAATTNEKIGAVIKAVCVQTGASTYQWLAMMASNGPTSTIVTA